ncbi:unnamed protein product, partial [Candidula unifasciata]
MIDDRTPDPSSVFSAPQIHPTDNSGIRRHQYCNLNTQSNNTGYLESYKHQCHHIERPHHASQHKIVLKHQDHQTDRQNHQNQKEVFLKHQCDDFQTEDTLFHHKSIPNNPHDKLVPQKGTFKYTIPRNHSFEYTKLKTGNCDKIIIHNHSSERPVVKKTLCELKKYPHIYLANYLCRIHNSKCDLHRSISTFQRVILFIKLIVGSARQCFPRNFPLCATLFLSILVLQITSTSSAASVPVISSSPSNLQLNIGILVAESSDESFITRLRQDSNKAIEDFRNFIQLTEGVSNPTPLQVNCEIFSFNSTRNALSNLDKIFSNASIHAVLGVSTYDMHSSLILQAEVFDKAYFPVNSFIFTLTKTQSRSFAPTFTQRGKMLAVILDTYKWQKLHIIFSNHNIWQDFATHLYLVMTSLDFKVTLGKAVSVPITVESAHIPLKDVGQVK